MSYDPHADLISRIALGAFVVIVLVGLVVLLSGHGFVPDLPANRVSPSGVTTTMGSTPSTTGV